MQLEVKNISFRYANEKILHDFSLELKPGDFTMLLGPNGSGKSTVLKVLAGFLSPTTGDVFLNGTRLKDIPNRDRARLVAVVPQSTPPALDYTVEDMVMMGRLAHLPRLISPAHSDGCIVNKALKTLEVSHLKKRRCNQLSGGERQRVAIAAALAQQPSFLLLDEPTSALDPAHAFNVMESLKGWTEPLGVLVVSHDLNLALRYAKHVFFLRNGVKQASGRPRDTITASNIENIYQCRAKIFLSQTESYVYLMPSLKKASSPV